MTLKLVNREVSTFAALPPQIFDLFLNLGQVGILVHLLVGFALCLDGLNYVRHHHVKVKYAFLYVLVLFCHKQEYIARFLS